MIRDQTGSRFLGKTHLTGDRILLDCHHQTATIAEKFEQKASLSFRNAAWKTDRHNFAKANKILLPGRV